MASSVPVRSIRSLTRVRRSRTALVRPVDVVGIVVSASPGVGCFAARQSSGAGAVEKQPEGNRTSQGNDTEPCESDVDDAAQAIAVLGDVDSQRGQFAARSVRSDVNS